MWKELVMRCPLIAAVVFCVSGQAFGVAEVTAPAARFSENYIEWFGGLAIYTHTGSDGAGSGGIPDVYSGIMPTDSHISGSAAGFLDYVGIIQDYAFEWDQYQNYGVTSNSIMADGFSYLAAAGSATLGLGGWNYQEIHFTVANESTAYHLTGLLTGGQHLSFMVYDSGLDQWFPVLNTIVSTEVADTVIDDSGNLAPGLYRLFNYSFSFVADLAPPIWDTTWDWEIAFPDAIVHDQTPEPGSLGLMAVGGAAMVLRRRRNL